MRKTFNFLQHEKAVEEILKHKWIESEKAQRDVGFVSAAFDWIKKHGNAWKQAHRIVDEQHVLHLGALRERRKYRRFFLRWKVRIRHGRSEFKAQLKECNHIGANVVSNVALAVGSKVEIVPQRPLRTPSLRSMPLKAQVIRSIPLQDRTYLLATLFESETQRAILEHKQALFN